MFLRNYLPFTATAIAAAEAKAKVSPVIGSS